MGAGPIGLVTALVPFLGYELCADVAKEAFRTGRPVREILLERKALSAEELDELLKPENMIRPVAASPKRSPKVPHV